MKKLFVILSIFMLVGSMLVPAAMAFDTSSGTELQPAYDAISQGIGGYWGMTFAIVAVAVGLFLAWQFRNVLIFLGGIVAAVLVPHIVTIITNMGACF
ncbi:hypothetical protein BLFGPEAP_01156 [Candidatus Methanoperedenaceae archaeon GB50]|nr:hypothetical protein BLFGPEAP_01156 [Candidatus Methanoperedenaceae archaeon GB50]